MRLLKPIEHSITGVLIEDKRWTISVHYRLVKEDAVPSVIAQARLVASQLGLHVMEGRKIVELRPDVRIDKGTACVAFAGRIGALQDDASAMYAGDDRTDEDAFRELRARQARAVTARVVASDEDLSYRSSAEFLLASPDELRQALEWLAVRRERTA